MRWQGLLNLGLGIGAALVSTGTVTAQTQTLPAPSFPPQNVVTNPVSTPSVVPSVPAVTGPVAAQPSATPGIRPLVAPSPVSVVQKVDAPPAKAPGMEPLAVPPVTKIIEGENCPGGGGGGADDAPWGPTPFPKVGILQKLLFGDVEKPCINVGAWFEGDYTYRSTGPGLAFNPTGGPGIAPVMNRFGNEAVVRELGLMIVKPLDNTTWSWGFNIIALAGADANFLAPTKGWYPQTDPRFGFDFTDLNLTAHLPILTEGGVDVKIGRQTTILGPMGALAWQRPFGSSDYAWYNMEEGRYTGISAVWHINKQLDWYNGIEEGWGTFFANYSVGPQYITNISYWLDEEAKRTRIWTTVLTGPTGLDNDGNTTVFELGIQQNWNKYLWTIVDTQMVYSKAPIFAVAPPGYIERAYDIYTYNGIHLSPCWDLNTRLEWYYDVDGGGYAGGFGIPHTQYYAGTIGVDWHPTKWFQFRPEIRYDMSNHAAFGNSATNLHDNQLSIDLNVVIKF